MTEESKAEFGVATGAVKAILSDVGDLRDRLGAEVGKLVDFSLLNTCSVELSSGA